jgi:peptide/nickel transport system substrate-binding protein
MKKTVIFVLAFFLIGFSVMAGGKSEKLPDSGQVLRIIHPVNTGNWSPLQGGGHEVRWISFQWAYPIYFDARGNLHPYVFKSWRGNSDNTVWTFEIDEKAKFSDGSAITSADVVGSWNLSARPDTKHQRVGLFLGGVKGYEDVSLGRAKNMSGLAAKGPLTVEATLTAPDPIFYQKIATALIPPVKISQAEDANGNQKTEWWHPKNNVAVSGPFMPQSMDMDTGIIVLVKNPNFFGPAPKLDSVVIQTVSDDQTATLMMQRGQMDAHSEFNTPTMIQDLGKEFADGVMLARGHHFWLDSRKPPMDDINVRKALIMAVDSKVLFSVAFPDGPNEPATQILNKVKGTDPNFVPYPYDPAAAKAALAASKYKNAASLPKIMFVGVSNPSHEAAAQYVAEQWRQVLGIQGTEMKPEIDSYEGPSQANIQIFRDDVGTRVPDAVSYLMGTIHSTSGNAQSKMGQYKNARVDSLLEEAAVKGADDPQRIALAQEAQKLFREDWQYIPYRYDTMSKWAMPWVLNFNKNDDWQVVEPWNVSIDEAVKTKMTGK